MYMKLEIDSGFLDVTFAISMEVTAENVDQCCQII